MQVPTFDPGITQQYSAPVSRIINPDGSFNVRRRGVTWRDSHPYLQLIHMTWPKFFALVFLAYVTLNTLFALLYYAVGVNQLQGAEAPTAFQRFANAFFFSAHTLSTVGYGSISPRGMGANTVAATESLVGVLGFAVATGLLYGRFSRASARIGFSERMLVSPYLDGKSLQFRVVNRRRNSIVELEARVMLMTVVDKGGRAMREYRVLKLERDRVIFFPLTWTVVHPIDSESPLYGKTAEDLRQIQAEVLIFLKGYDESFSQIVMAKRSYRYDEIVWERRFAPAFYVDPQGDLVLDMWKLGAVAEEKS